MKRIIAPISFALLVLFSCSKDEDDKLVPLPEGAVSLVNAFPNLEFSRPLDLQSPDDGTNRIFVAEQGGSIKVFPNDETTQASTTFLDLENRTVSTGELGLLGFAFHPNYSSNGFFYVTYTPTEDMALVSRFQVSGTSEDIADIASETILLRIPQPETNHNGGQLAFGPDGYLYIASGDGGGGGDPQGNAQNLENLLGAILRIDVDVPGSEANYSIPSDNPFVNMNNARGEIYAYGLRNPWRFSFDEQTKSIWTGDVGQGEMEEINVIEKGGNYGWNILEGTSCFGSDTCDGANTIAPVFEYNHDANDRSITGGYVYRGDEVSTLKGYYIYGDFISGRIWALDSNLNGSPSNQLLVESGLNISSFGTDNANEIYVCSFDGKIYKFKESE